MVNDLIGRRTPLGRMRGGQGAGVLEGCRVICSLAICCAGIERGKGREWCSGGASWTATRGRGASGGLIADG